MIFDSCFFWMKSEIDSKLKCKPILFRQNKKLFNPSNCLQASLFVTLFKPFSISSVSADCAVFLSAGLKFNSLKKPYKITAKIKFPNLSNLYYNARRKCVF
jgi:hypothetical protein